MASEEHLAILNQGVEVWNQWRNENSSIKPDLSRANLARRNLNDANLRGANFHQAILTRTSFISARLAKSNFNKSNLAMASFCKANLGGASFRGANLNTAYFSHAEAAYADFTDADLSQAVLNYAVLESANFNKANLTKASFFASQVIQANFSGTTFTGAYHFEMWNSSKVNLDDIECLYIYLNDFGRERCPKDRDFEVGEFSKLFQADRSYNRLAVLDQIVCRFEKLLNDNPQGNESLFHNFLKENPSLLDLYGIVESEPQFYYLSNEFSPTGKSRLEPDFIICYPGNRYKLVEIEKPGKQIATKQGHPTSQFTQASWQLGEWEHYIKNYPYLLKEKYSGISTHRSSMLVIGRRISSEHMELLAENFPHDEVFTYDDLLDKAKQAHAALVALSI